MIRSILNVWSPVIAIMIYIWYIFLLEFSVQPYNLIYSDQTLIGKLCSRSLADTYLSTHQEIMRIIRRTSNAGIFDMTSFWSISWPLSASSQWTDDKYSEAVNSLNHPGRHYWLDEVRGGGGQSGESGIFLSFFFCTFFHFYICSIGETVMSWGRSAHQRANWLL